MSDGGVTLFASFPTYICIMVLLYIYSLMARIHIYAWGV